MSHMDEHITDPATYRLKASPSGSSILLAWDYPGSTLLRVRIQRSPYGFAEYPDQGELADKRADDQAIVYEGTTGSFRDRDVRRGETYFYTFWARRDEAAGEPWTSWGGRRLRAFRPSRLARALARMKAWFGRLTGRGRR
jgi:hypothetical protein